MFPEKLENHVEIIGDLQWGTLLSEEEAEDRWPSGACTLCRHDFTDEELQESPNCSSCDARERTRTIVVLDYYLSRINKNWEEEEILAFALTQKERSIIEHNFGKICSASLFGSYGEGHQVGVDVRDLSRYKQNRFCGSFSSLLFDYFEEHDLALSELNRVIKSGGILITHVSSGRFSNKYVRPAEVRRVTANQQKKNMEYLGNDSIPHVMFTKEWLFNAIGRNGFQPGVIVVRDPATRNSLYWYVGVKDMEV